MKADFNYVCTLWTNDGMGRVGEELLLALDKLEVKLNVIPDGPVLENLKQRTKELINTKYEPSEKTIFYSIPQVLEKYHTKENYLHIPWDTTIPPKIWIELINKYATKVFPCSDFVRDIFKRNGITVPIQTVKHGVNNEDFPYLERVWDKQFTFLTLGNISMRKGTDVLIRAFQKAFPTENNVELIIKSNKTMEWGKIKLPIDVRIKIIEEVYSPEKMQDLLRKSHCYVAPSRSEGFCLPACEAMASGMGLILHNWAGMSMMVNSKYNFVLETSGQIPAQADIYPEEYQEGNGIGNWGEPNEEKLIGLLRYCYERREEVKEKGLLASEWTRDSWGWEHSAKALLSGTTKPDQNWGDFYRNDTLTKNNVIDSINSHKELFWLIRGFKPDKILESGTGTGEMAGFLTWEDQNIMGKEPTNHHPKEITAIDNNEEVLTIAKINLKSIDGEKVQLKEGNVFDFDETADLIFSQGLMEHMSNEEMLKFIEFQLTKAPILVHSIPNNNYGNLDYGNERLLSDEEYYKIFKNFDLTIYRYWDEEGVKKQSNLVFKKQTDIKTSIIMIVHNHKDMTIKAIEAIKANTKDYEFIVIDNASTDGIEKWLDEQEDIRTVHLDHNYGIPKPKNLAMTLARGKYICFVDNDTVAGPGWLEPMVDLLENDPKVGFTAHEGYLIDRNAKNLNGPKVTNGEVDWASHSVFLFRRSSIKETGMLMDIDEWCLEDVDQCLHFKSLGYIGKIPEIQPNIIHYASTTAKELPYATNHLRHFEITNLIWEKWKTTI